MRILLTVFTCILLACSGGAKEDSTNDVEMLSEKSDTVLIIESIINNSGIEEYFHLDKNDNTIKILLNNTIKKNIHLTKEDVKFEFRNEFEKSVHFVEFTSFIYDKKSAKVELNIPFEGITQQVNLEYVNGNWVIKDSVINER